MPALLCCLPCHLFCRAALWQVEAICCTAQLRFCGCNSPAVIFPIVPKQVRGGVKEGGGVDSRLWHPDVLVHQIERHSSLLSRTRIAALECVLLFLGLRCCCRCCNTLQGFNNDISRPAIKAAQRQQQQQKDVLVERVFAFAGATAVSIDAALD